MYINLFKNCWTLLSYTRKKFDSGKIWQIWWIVSYLPMPIFTDIPKMYLAYALTSLFSKFFLANSFYLYGLPKFSLTKYFPCVASDFKVYLTFLLSNVHSSQYTELHLLTCWIKKIPMCGMEPRQHQWEYWILTTRPHGTWYWYNTEYSL